MDDNNLNNNTGNLAADLRQQLVDFVRTDLALGFTMIETARIASPDHREKTLATVRRAISTIRNYLGEIGDSQLCEELERQVNELEKSADELQP